MSVSSGPVNFMEKVHISMAPHLNGQEINTSENLELVYRVGKALIFGLQGGSSAPGPRERKLKAHVTGSMDTVMKVPLRRERSALIIKKISSTVRRLTIPAYPPQTIRGIMS